MLHIESKVLNMHPPYISSFLLFSRSSYIPSFLPFSHFQHRVFSICFSPYGILKNNQTLRYNRYSHCRLYRDHLFGLNAEQYYCLLQITVVIRYFPRYKYAYPFLIVSSAIIVYAHGPRDEFSELHKVA